MKGFSRKMVTILFLVLALAVLIPYTLPMRNGKPLLPPPTFHWPTLPAFQLPSWSTTQEDSPKPVTVYRWRDGAGIWQYGSTPPPGTAYETQQIDPRANVMTAVTTAAPKTDPAPRDADAADSSSAAPSYAPERVKQLFDDAHKLREQSEQRQALQEQL